MICLVVLFFFNISMLIYAFRVLSDTFSKRFDKLLETMKQIMAERDVMIKEGFDERDARFKRMQSILTQTIIRDADLYVGDLPDPDDDDEELIDEYPESNPNGA